MAMLFHLGSKANKGCRTLRALRSLHLAYVSPWCMWKRALFGLWLFMFLCSYASFLLSLYRATDTVGAAHSWWCVDTWGHCWRRDWQTSSSWCVPVGTLLPHKCVHLCCWQMFIKYLCCCHTSLNKIIYSECESWLSVSALIQTPLTDVEIQQCEPWPEQPLVILRDLWPTAVRLLQIQELCFGWCFF